MKQGEAEKRAGEGKQRTPGARGQCDVRQRARDRGMGDSGGVCGWHGSQAQAQASGEAGEGKRA